MLARIVMWIIVLVCSIGCAAPTLPVTRGPSPTSVAPNPIGTPRPTLIATEAVTATVNLEELDDHYLLAFASERDNMPGIYLTDRRGRWVHLITREAMETSHPAWSPDGSRLAFTAKKGAQHELVVVDANGENLTQLTRDQGDNFYPTWSPDGQRIAFASNRSGEYQIYAVRADGSDVQRLTDTTVREEKPAWSPDGSRIAFMSTRDGNAEVYVMNADGSSPTNLTQHRASDLNPAWSPDGKLIAFNSTRGTGEFGIYIMQADGSQVRPLLEGGGWYEKPAWSPDGTQIAFYSNRDGNAEVYMIRADGTRMQRLTYQAGWDGQPTWLPRPIEVAAAAPCPVTLPNGQTPPDEQAVSTEHHGNGALWTVLPADGILYLRHEPEGWLTTKLPWWREVTGTLSLEGRRLDGTGKFSAHVPDGYDPGGFQPTGVYFSSEGCWEVTGRVGSAELKFVVDVYSID
jgi:dipeptidyl aminopeptidase/acylaminoacyl peptidase